MPQTINAKLEALQRSVDVLRADQAKIAAANQSRFDTLTTATTKLQSGIDDLKTLVGNVQDAGGASSEELDAFGKRVANTRKRIQNFDASITGESNPAAKKEKP